MKKKLLTLLLALAMAVSLLTMPATAEVTPLAGTGTLADKTFTVSIEAENGVTAVASGDQDVYVTFTVSVQADQAVPAFSFVLLPTNMELADTVYDAQTNNQFYYQIQNADTLYRGQKTITGGQYTYANPDALYDIVSYTAKAGGAARNYFCAGGADAAAAGITGKTAVLKIVGKIPAGTPAGEAKLSVAMEGQDVVVAGTGKVVGTEVKVSEQFCRTVVPATVSVSSDVSVSGTLKMDNAAVTGITAGAVELYQGETKVATGTLNADGTYSFTNVSTGSYTVKAVDVKAGGKTLNGSADVTVAGSNVTGKDIAVAEGIKGDVNNDGVVNAKDRTHLARYLAHWPGYSLTNEKVADVNGDNVVNAKDRTHLARYLAHWPGYTLS